MCDKLRIPRRPPSIFGARRGEIQDDLDPVSISAPTSWCASVVPCSVTAAMLTSRFGPICSIALGSKEMDRRCQLPFRASGSSSSLMAVRYTEPIRTLGRSVPSQVLGSTLGQLTAGIAHEIKNPLNFVNNFSGVSAELMDELQQALEDVKSQRKEAWGDNRADADVTGQPREGGAARSARGFDRQEHAAALARRLR